MVPIETLFVGLVIFFGLIGALRGWAKELLVTFAVILARFIELVLWRFVPVVGAALQTLADTQPKQWFFTRLAIFMAIILAGYATTKLLAALGIKARKDKVQDSLLGFFLGALNGFLIVGIVWGFLAEPKLNYQVWNIVPPSGAFARDLVRYLPLTWLTDEMLFIGVAVSFALVLIVFV